MNGVFPLSRIVESVFGGFINFKVLTPQDKESITDLFRRVFTREPWNDDWSDSEQLAAYIDDLIGQSNSLTLGYLDGDRLVGLAMGRIKHWYEGTEYCIYEFCVDTEIQNQGFGSAFLIEIEAYLSQNDVRYLFLQTDRTVPAYKFYTCRGFFELIDNVSLAKKIDG